MEPDLNAVLASLAKHVGDLTVRLTLAEARVAAYERAEVDRAAAKEGQSADD